MKLLYPYVVQAQEGGFFIQFVDLEGAFTEGETLEEAAFNAAEVLTGLLAYRMENGESLPEPSPADGRPVASPNAAVQSALLLREARGDRPLSDLARALETSRAAAQRLEDPKH